MERLLEKFYDAYVLELRCGQRLQVYLKYLNSSMIIILQLPGGSVKWEGKIILDSQWVVFNLWNLVKAVHSPKRNEQVVKAVWIVSGRIASS